MKYDRVTEKIQELLGKIPYVGKDMARLYLWKPTMFNYMLVGASGTFLSWLLYEGFFRPLLAPMFAGTFIGMVIVTVLVYLWNFTWNKRWSLSLKSQIMNMNRKELEEARNILSDRMNREE